MKNVFITGVSGFLGQSLVKHFKDSDKISLFGYSRDREKAKSQFKHDRITIVNNDPSSELFNELRIDTIIHLAGIAHDLSGQYKAEDYFKVNDLNTRNLYNEFLKSNVSRFVFLSSIKAAIDIASAPITENVDCNPVTPYGQSKRQAEMYIMQHPLPAGKHYYILRPCMIHGPGNKGNLNLLYKFVKGGLPYPLGAFVNKRSFLSVDNFNFVINQLISGSIDSGVYHLADEGYLSTTELYKIIAVESGKKPLILNFPSGIIRFVTGIIGKKHMINKLTEDMMVSNEKLVQQLGQPLPVQLRDGLAKTIRSFRES